MQAGHHSNILADHEATGIIAAVKGNASIYLVEANKTDSPFLAAYHDLLTSQLASKGATIVTKPYKDSLTVTYRTQVLHHNDRGYLAPTPGTYTILAAGLGLISQAIENWSDPEILLAPAAIGADLFSGGWTSKTPTELLITTQVQSGSNVLMSNSSLYYLNSGDSSDYSSNYGNTRPLSVVDQ